MGKKTKSGLEFLAGTSKERKSDCNRFLKNYVKPATLDYRPRFDFGEAEKRGIRVVPLDFASGTSPNGIEPLIRPLPPSQVDALLAKTEPWVPDAYYSDFINDSEILPSSRRQEARSLYYLIHQYLTLNKNKDGSGSRIIPSFTKWRAFGHEIPHLFRYKRDDIGCDWYVHDVWRYCAESPSDMYYEGELDLSKPHVTCFLADHQELKDGFISTSELTTIYWLALFNSLLFREETLFPVTVVSASYRTVRIVQGVVNIRTSAIELRVSQLIPFEKGIRADTESWQRFTTLLGWILGEPIGDTKLA